MLATIAEADREYADNVGRDNPDQEWILSDRDVWYRNPSYSGPRGRHPEDDEPDHDDMLVGNVGLTYMEAAAEARDMARWFHCNVVVYRCDAGGFGTRPE